MLFLSCLLPNFAKPTAAKPAEFRSPHREEATANVKFDAQNQTPQRIDTLINENWKFQLDPAETPIQLPPKSHWQSVNLPHTWNNKDIQSGGKYAVGSGWYEKVLTLTPEQFDNHEAFLHFDGVSSVADVFVNGKYLGEHKGGFSAFTFDATSLLKLGENIIQIRADNSARPDVIPINNGLFPIFGGAYRSVHLLLTPRVAISPLEAGTSGVFLSEPNVSPDSADLQARVNVQNFTNQYHPATIMVQLLTDKGVVVAQESKSIEPSSGPLKPFTLNLTVNKPRLWAGRADPYEYTLKTELTSNLGTDIVLTKIGIRSVGVRPGGGFLLNGEPYRLYGVCRHQDKQDEGNALQDWEQREDARTIFELGATSVRLSHYQQSQAIYSEFDADGIVVWAESPFVNASSGKESENAVKQYRELILQNYNHPSIAFWGSSNEVYGKSPQDYVPTLLRRLANVARELDPYRLNAETSGTGSDHGAEVGYSDVQGMNRYYGWYYGKTGDLAKWIDGMKKKRPGLAYAITEYGAGANPAQQAETLPETVNATGQYFPEGLQTRIHELAWLEIEKHPEIVASYVWVLNDFAVPGWNRGALLGRNLKGLVTYDRKIRKDAFYWYKANWSKDPVLYLVGRRNSQRKVASADIEVFSNQGKPTVTVNGVGASVEAGLNGVDWVVKGVTLKPGENKINATLAVKGKPLSDSMTWFLSQ